MLILRSTFNLYAITAKVTYKCWCYRRRLSWLMRGRGANGGILKVRTAHKKKTRSIENIKVRTSPSSDLFLLASTEARRTSTYPLMITLNSLIATEAKVCQQFLG